MREKGAPTTNVWFGAKSNKSEWLLVAQTGRTPSSSIAPHKYGVLRFSESGGTMHVILPLPALEFSDAKPNIA
jgi:hypothetical protein